MPTLFCTFPFFFVVKRCRLISNLYLEESRCNFRYCRDILDGANKLKTPEMTLEEAIRQLILDEFKCLETFTSGNIHRSVTLVTYLIFSAGNLTSWNFSMKLCLHLEFFSHIEPTQISGNLTLSRHFSIYIIKLKFSSGRENML